MLGDSQFVGPLFDAGVTEWRASYNGVVVSLGWDWIRLQDGAIVALKAAPPRSNLMALDAKGYDLAPDELTSLLWEVISAIGWEGEAARALCC